MDPAGESLTRITISATNSLDTKTTLVRDGNTSHYSVHFKATDQLAVFGGSPAPNRFVISGEVSDYSAVDFEGGAKIWSNAQWAASAVWTGEAVHGGPCTLDIPEAGCSQSAVL